MHFISQTLLVFIASFVVGSFAAPQWAAAQSGPSAITIGFIPGENPDTLRENGNEIAKLLEEKLGTPVKIFVSQDYAGLVDAMKTKKVDFAFFSAMTFVFAEKQADAKVLLKKVWKEPYYYSVILARKDSKISRINQLKGKRFAFVDRQSASGFLYPQAYFKKQNIDPTKLFSETIFSGNHEESVRLLAEKKVDAIAVYSNDAKSRDTAWAHYPKVRDAKKQPPTGAVQTLWTSAPIPNDPFCVRRDFYDQFPKLSHDLMFALIELQDDPKDGDRFKKLLGVSSLVLATSQQYESVREVVKELDLKL